MVRVGLIAEDQSDRSVLREILCKLEPATRFASPVGANGIGEILSRWSRLVDLVEDADVLVLCVDSDGRPLDRDPLRRFLVELQATAHILAVPVQSIEAWLLGDPAAVRMVTGHRGFRPIPNTEAVPDPKRVLRQAVRQGRRRPDFRERLDNPNLAKALDLTVAAAANSSLRRFIQAMRPHL